MMGHHQAWDYGWSFFNLAIEEAIRWLKPPDNDK